MDFWIRDYTILHKKELHRRVEGLGSTLNAPSRSLSMGSSQTQSSLGSTLNAPGRSFSMGSSQTQSSMVLKYTYPRASMQFLFGVCYVFLDIGLYYTTQEGTT